MPSKASAARSPASASATPSKARVNRDPDATKPSSRRTSSPSCSGQRGIQPADRPLPRAGQAVEHGRGGARPPPGELERQQLGGGDDLVHRGGRVGGRAGLV